MAGRWAGEEPFLAAYDALLARWPVAVEPVDVASPYGTTRVNVCGPPDGVPLVLLHGGGATSTVWYANVGALATRHRVYALDQLGGPGRSVADGRPIRRADDLTGWLDAVYAGLGLERAHLCGHSYGGWQALAYALHAPDRVSRLALLDPTMCFAGMRAGYLLRGLPHLVRPTARRYRSLIEWETAGTPVDPDWLALAALGAEFPAPRPVMTRRPRPERLRSLTAPTLIVLAGRSRAHDIRRVAAAAERLVPDAVVRTLPGTSHHSMPAADSAELNRLLTTFLAP